MFSLRVPSFQLGAPLTPKPFLSIVLAASWPTISPIIVCHIFEAKCVGMVVQVFVSEEWETGHLTVAQSGHINTYY